MQTLDLWPASTGANNPSSSFLAEERITRSGQRKTNYTRVLDELKKRPRSTAAEIAFYLDMNPVEVRRRLTDAKNKNHAIQCNQRQCRVAKTAAVTWEATV